MTDETDDPSRTFQMRVRKSFMDKIDAWRRHQDDLPPVAEAIRRLVEIALSSEGNKGGSGTRRKAKGRE
jgi:hypothetical protein